MLESLYIQTQTKDFIMNKLKFSKCNTKLNEMAVELGLPKSQVVAFNLPAGHTCPFADKCKSRAHRITGHITDGQRVEYRCYAASVESRYPAARQAVWHNFELLKGLDTDQISDLIIKSLPSRVKIVRIHSSGDFYSKAYFNAWVKVAESLPHIQFFAYTKALHYVSASKPDNLSLIYSYGGKLDAKLTTEPVSYVVKNFDEAKKLGLPVVCQTSMAEDYTNIIQGKSFALMIHGTQPAKA
jgi:hypothetical protein